MRRFLLRESAALLLACLCLLLATPTAAEESSAKPSEASGWTVLDERPASGEQCLVCKKAIHDGNIIELRYKGRTFHVAGAMLERFEQDPELFFSSLEAHSALFDESASGPPMSNGWLYFGIYVLVGLVFGALCSYIALAKGKPASTWFFAGLVGNVLALGALAGAPRGDLSGLPSGVPPGLAKIPTTYAPLDCEQCGNSVHPSATACPSCGHALQPIIEAESARV